MMMSNILEEQGKKKLKLSIAGQKKKNPSPQPQDVLKVDEPRRRSKRYNQSLKPEETLILMANSEHHTILSNFNVLTGEKHRDKWLERLLQGIQSIRNLRDHSESETTDIPKNHTSLLKEEIEMLPWPDAFVPVVVALEKMAYDTLSSDFHKYNQMMRHLFFNLKKYNFLAQRFLIGELEPSQLLNMSPNELKDGFAAEECAVDEETEEPNSFRMTDAICKRCTEKKVCVVDIIQTGGSGRYRLECVSCGNTWYASIDEVFTLTIESPRPSTAVGEVGVAHLATSKFEEVERKFG